MTRVRDLVRGWRVVLEPRDRHIRIAMLDHDGDTVVDSRIDALSLAGEWLHIISEDWEVDAVTMQDARQTVQTLLTEAVATMLMDDDTERTTADLGEWFTQQWEGDETCP